MKIGTVLAALIGAVTLGLLNSTPAFANTYAFSFISSVTYIDSGLEAAGGPTIGSQVFGQFQYDTSIAKSPISTPTDAVYPVPGLPYWLAFNGLLINGVGELGVQNVGVNVVNNGPVEDHFTFAAFTGPGEATVTGNGTNIGAFRLTQIGVALTDSTGAVFSSLALPVVLSIGSFDDLLVRVLYFNDSTRAFERFDATITNLSLEQTPLPGALPLFLTGIGALGLIGWRRKRS